MHTLRSELVFFAGNTVRELRSDQIRWEAYSEWRAVVKHYQQCALTLDANVPENFPLVLFISFLLEL